MVAALVNLGAWVGVTLGLGSLALYVAISEAYSTYIDPMADPRYDPPTTLWLTILIVWLPTVVGCILAAFGWWSIHERRAAAVKNTIALLRSMQDLWRHGYTFLALAAAIGGLVGLGGLNGLALGNLLVWGGLHLWLYLVRKGLMEAAHHPEAAPPAVVPSVSQEVASGPATDYEARAAGYLKHVEPGGEGRAVSPR